FGARPEPGDRGRIPGETPGPGALDSPPPRGDDAPGKTCGSGKFTRLRRGAPMDVDLVRMAIANRRRVGLLPTAFSAPGFVLWEITYACPLRCIHCYNHSGDAPPKQLPTDQLLKIADQFGDLQVHSVCLTGGEPSVHKGYLDVARRLKDHQVSVGTPLS